MTPLEERIEQPFRDRILFIGGEGEGIPKLRDDVAKCVFMGTPDELIAAVVAVLPTADVSDEEIEAAYVKAGAVIMPTPAMLAAVHGLLDAQAAAHAAEVDALRAEVERLNVELTRGVVEMARLVRECDAAEADRDAYRALIDAVRALWRESGAEWSVISFPSAFVERMDDILDGA